jgi:hypothetical protein
MAVGARGGRTAFGEVRLDETALRDLASPAGPVARYLARGAQVVTQSAKRRAPVSPRGSGGRSSGYLRSQIGWTTGTDPDGPWVAILSPALTSGRKPAPYGLFQNVPVLYGRTRTGRRYRIKTTPHLLPALADWPGTGGRTPGGRQ